VKRLLLPILLLLALTAFGQSSASPSSSSAAKPRRPEKPGQVAPNVIEPDDGTINDRLYSSDYFRFRFTVPEGFVADEYPAGDQEDASHRSFVLLVIYGEGERRGSVLSILADQAAPTGATTASAYLTKVTTTLMKQEGFTWQPPVRSLTLGGRSFAAADFTQDETAQTVLVTMLRGYAVSFVLMGPARADVERLAAALNTLEFVAAEKPRTAPAAAPAR
jgi:hypothetical protein